MVGNGLSNQNFVLGPGGLIVIDTGECCEEMQYALDQVRKETDAPIAAVIYTHFHYVGGTKAVAAAAPDGKVAIWAHERVPVNRRRMAGEASTVMNRGVVHQFGTRLKPTGPDGLLGVGLGLAFRNAEHAPFTPGYLPPTTLISGPTKTEIAGLRVEFEPTPSDADDSITIWFPDLGVCVNNNVWPTLFNVYAIRGEEYRDPRGLLRGLDHILALEAEHLVGAHGPPISGRAEVTSGVRDSRDAIQFLWDQTVRGLNKGLTGSELTSFVRLPKRFERTYLTQQHYGLVEHHVRQIQAGMIGWFDGNEANLLPLPEAERSARLIEGFGGRTVVAEKAAAALAADDLRWALELATWLVRSDVGADGRADTGTPDERRLLASVLRSVAERTTASNIRNWCLTRALELEGTLDLNRLRIHQFRMEEVLGAPADTYVRVLRVLLDPTRSDTLDHEVRFEFTDGTTVGLHVRGGVAVPTSGAGATSAIALDLAAWAKVLSGTATFADTLRSGAIRVVAGDESEILGVFSAFDHPSFTNG